MGDSGATKAYDVDKEKFVSACIVKEDELRLKWFEENEQKLQAEIHKPLKRTVPDEALEELKKNRQAYHVHREKFGRREIGEPEPPHIDPEALKHVMRPIDGDTLNILYACERDCRKTYLRERINLIPEKRYYCPETTSFMYGWNTWDHAKARHNYGFGRSQIIKGSFYRRRGVGRDPDWYTEPERLSPSTCL